MKNKKVLKILLASALSMTMLVGFAESKTELMGGNYARFGQMNVETSKSKLVEVVDDQIYFIADGSNENITEYCSMEDYYIKQLVVDDYMHTIVIGGDISGNLNHGGLGELGFINQIDFIGEFERELVDGNLTSEAIYSWPEPHDSNSNYVPIWFEKASIEHENIDELKIPN